MQSIQIKFKTDWCRGCVDRVGIRRFRQLTINNVCEDCDKRIKPQDRKSELIEQIAWQQSVKKISDEKLQLQKEREYCRASKLREEERQLIKIFQELQMERCGIWWRKSAAERLNWSASQIKEVIKRVRRYESLVPTPITEHIVLFVKNEYQTARQIHLNFDNFKIDWICITLERLVAEKRIQKQVNKPYETLYRLPPIG